MIVVLKKGMTKMIYTDVQQRKQRAMTLGCMVKNTVYDTGDLPPEPKP